RRDVQQHPVVAVGFRFPIYAAAEIDMAAVAFFTCIQERMVRSGHVAMIGERRGLEINEARLCLSADGKAANDNIWHAMKRRNLLRSTFGRCEANRRHDLRGFCRCPTSTGLRNRSDAGQRTELVKSRHSVQENRCPLCAKSGLMHCSKKDRYQSIRRRARSATVAR